MVCRDCGYAERECECRDEPRRKPTEEVARDESTTLRAEVERLTRANAASVARADTMMARAEALLVEIAERTRERDEAVELLRASVECTACSGDKWSRHSCRDTQCREFLARVKP